MSSESSERLPIGTAVQVACLLEVAAPKPGNVYPSRDFPHMSWLDFAVTAAIIGPILDKAPRRRLGETILEAVRTSRRWTRSNANLGIVLMLSPLAKAYDHDDIASGTQEVLAQLDADDAAKVYEAIRIANPKGLGDANEHDVRGPAPADLIEAMRSAQDRDLIARQYATNFADLFDEARPLFSEILSRGNSLQETTVLFQLEWMRRHPDSDISRSCGLAEAEEAGRRAGQVIDAGWPKAEGSQESLAILDDWLREDGHRRNPGTTADIVAAVLFLSVRDGIIGLPLRREDS